MFWYEISRLPTSLKDRRRMFVVKAIDIVPPGCSILGLYTTDPYCVWMENEKFVRWPHPFLPTHFAILPTEIE